MSMDAGGLAQMTYNNHSSVGGLGMPSGFASRGKGGNIKRLSVPPPSKITTIDENQPAPRTSRSHLLAGLRTAPKSPGFPTSAPPTQLQQPGGLNDSRYAPLNNRQYQHQATPKTATGSAFPNSYHDHPSQFSMNQFYSPDQILAPPSIQLGEGFDESQMDPQVYEDLVRTNQYLAQQQARLQQQLINVTAAAQQFQNLNLSQNQEQAFNQIGINPAMGFYNQQLSQGMQPIVQPIPGHPGLYAVYNPMTGQTNVHVDGAQQEQMDLCQSPPPQTPTTFRAQQHSGAPQSPTPLNPMSNWRSNSPPKTSPSPPRDETAPLPPPSANAFRPSHRKNNLSLASTSLNAPPDGVLRTGGGKLGFPQTPMTGTFGPGQAREGEHPIRQPRGPPSMEELVAKPTTKFEGSKNFASRQRRGALNHLVRAGIERRGARSHGSVGSASSGSPTSERNLSALENDDVSVRSGSASLDGQPEDSSQSPMMNAIGSERKGFKERSRERIPLDSQLNVISANSDDDTVGGKLLEIKSEAAKDTERRKSPLLVLANAEKRRSFVN